MPTEGNSLIFKIEFAWRGIALLASIELAYLLSKQGDMPIGSLATAAILWAFIGFKPRRPVMAAAITTFCVLFAGFFFWNVPKKFGVFVPIWVALWFVPRALGWIGRRVKKLLKQVWFSRALVLVWVDRLLTSVDRFPRFAEFFRLAVSILGPLAAIAPFLHDGVMGGDDARWYAAVVADHVKQWHSGMGPVFVGQTRFAALGTVMPLRVAPYLQHLTLAIDYLSGQRLTAYLLINIAITASAMAGGLSAYISIRSILPNHRTEACLLALLYIWCPAVIGLAYNGQLFMSTMTWPFLPLVFLGIVKIYEQQSFTGWLIVSASCAMSWLCHSPIGLWATIAAAVAIMVRWLFGNFNRKELFLALAAGLAFAVLSGYEFVSVGLLSPDKTPPIAPFEVLATVRASVPGIFLPLSPTGSALSDYQPGYSLWIILGLCLAHCQWKRKEAATSLAAVASFLLLLLLPIPAVNSWLWHSFPQFIIEATNRAPGQRLYALLAACTVILGACTLCTYCGSDQKRRSKVALFLILAVIWSGLQLRPFLARGTLLANSAQASEESLSPQNLALSRYSLGLLSEHNRFFSNGVVDYNLEQRILALDLRTYLATNVNEVAPGFDGGPKHEHAELPGTLLGQADPVDGHFIVLSPRLHIEPDSHYLLIIDFPSQDLTGVLEVRGNGVHREYTLPMSGEPFAFGARHFASRVIPLSNGAAGAIDLTLTFINQGPDVDAGKSRTFARYGLLRYDPETLPIRLRSLLPYVADVHSPSRGWLETFRYFTPGWRAEVNGRPVQVRRSWNQLVAVPVNEGDSSVKLFYQPASSLVATYWITWAGWILLLVLSIVQGVMRTSRRAAREGAQSIERSAG